MVYTSVVINQTVWRLVSLGCRWLCNYYLSDIFVKLVPQGHIIEPACIIREANPALPLL